VDDLGIVEAPNDLEDGIYGADVREKLVTKASTSGRAAGQPGNVEDGEVGGNAGLWVELVAQPIEAGIGDDDPGFFGVNGSVREILQSASARVQRPRFPGATGFFLPQDCLGCIW